MTKKLTAATGSKLPPSAPLRLSDPLRLIELLTGASTTVMDIRIFPESESCQRTASARYRAGKSLPALKLRGTFDELEPLLRKRNLQGFEVFYSVNEMDGFGVKAVNCTRIRARALDLDGAPLPTDWQHGEPHIVIETSSGRYQALFLIKDGWKFAPAEQLNRDLAIAYGGDRSVCDRARVFRLPGFIHQKPGRKPFTARIVSTKDLLSFGPYPFRGLRVAVPPSSYRLRLKRSTQPEGNLNPEQAAVLFNHYPVKALSGNQAWQTFAMALHSACNGDERIAKMFFEFCMTDDAYDWADDQKNRDRWDSFVADKEGGITIATLRKLCYDAKLPSSVRFAIFNDAAKDFDDV